MPFSSPMKNSFSEPFASNQPAILCMPFCTPCHAAARFSLPTGASSSSFPPSRFSRVARKYGWLAGRRIVYTAGNMIGPREEGGKAPKIASQSATVSVSASSGKSFGVSGYALSR